MKADAKGVYVFPKAKPLVLIATLYKKGNKFQKKLCKVSVKQYPNNKEDSAGSVEVDLAEFVSMTEKSTPKEFTKLSKPFDKKAVLLLTLVSCALISFPCFTLFCILCCRKPNG